MSAKEFFVLVSEMRAMQREYFKTRTNKTLEQSKVLERMVDDEIKRVNDILFQRANPRFI